MSTPLTRDQKLFYFFLGGWVLFNLIQCFTTDLFHDEALYWAFSKRPALGYFDHPPLTAWLISMTSWVPGDLGVRLPFIAMSAGTMWFVWKMLEEKSPRLLIWLLIGVPLIHVGGFFAAPDVPLLFFMSAFLFVYKTYFFQDSWKTAIVLGVLLGLMGLSKYHAILFALALMASNVALFKRRSFYLMVLCGLLVIAPHLFWEWQNDWVSFQFHLFSRRGAQEWSWNFVGDYLAGQLVVYGLFLTILFWIASVKKAPDSHYDCAHKYTFWFVFGFFTLSVFRGRVEANWTAMAYIPMIYLTHRYIAEKANWKKWAVRLAIFSLSVTMILRLILAFEIIPAENMKRNETHGHRQWAEKIRSVAGDDPVIFINNYRKPAKYAYYTYGPTTSWNMAEYSGNQYDIWTQDEIAFQGKSVWGVSNELTGQDSIHFSHGIKSECLVHFDHWQSYNYIDLSASPPKEVSSGTTQQIEITISNPTGYSPEPGPNPVTVKAVFYQYESLKFETILIENLELDKLSAGRTTREYVTIQYPEIEGEYDLKFAIMSHDLPGLNSWPYKVIVGGN